MRGAFWLGASAGAIVTWALIAAAFWYETRNGRVLTIVRKR